ncbi:histidine--tRNA ligase [Geomonas sp. Red69]|uniref:Histidine--tRNA ligase n=1 Tax=Geomonas diazotrophica TaxID=2843197 RepID=A0ABX8JMG0_9BACT|nr:MULTISPECIES: histidine--tRNA ligase [Geomonas]MBU5636623.1 histidine--tRNA ligase [Geomonas diazotrophica]QWV98557.1 histidine--tRNA ligase [Geomonas nitrogeniifigens]QXE87740.1 histidine--tRNA ligase [Geomonas nitrogeniifigens]
MAITGIKGFNDILPGEVEKWQHIEATARRVFELYGLSEIRIPILEKTELFCRSIGDATDIVEKEMYSFEDKGGNKVTMRPEGTASVMRAYVEHKMHALDPVARLYYMGPMFRYERPQKGRYRQFHQIGAEITGVAAPTVDAQVLTMLTHFFQELGLTEPSLQINSLGCPCCRPAYREALKKFLLDRIDKLCDDCKRRYDTNPLRALDCKSAGCQEATQGAPSMLDHLCAECSDHFDKTRKHLELVGTPYSINQRMVRGLDYYTRTTFEMVTTMLGAQSAVAAGGRYDGLISSIGGPQIPGIGFAMGVERVALLLAEKDFSRRPDLFIAALGDEAHPEAFRLMSALQRLGFAVEIDYEGKSLKSQMRRADKFNSRFTLIIGGDELARGTAPLKNMDGGTQDEVALDAASIQAAMTGGA